MDILDPLPAAAEHREQVGLAQPLAHGLGGPGLVNSPEQESQLMGLFWAYFPLVFFFFFFFFFIYIYRASKKTTSLIPFIVVEECLV